MHNFQTEIVGHDQILAVFGPEHKQVISIYGCNRICNLYLWHGDYNTDNEAELMEEDFDNKGEDNIFRG